MTKSRGIRPRRGSVIAHFRENLYTVTAACKIWPYGCGGQNDYGIVFIDTKPFYVHRLACQAWNGPQPPGTEAAHGPCLSNKCFNGAHLSWKSHAANELDKFRDNTNPAGERNPMAKLTATDVVAIRTAALTETQAAIARRFDIKQSTVSNIVRRHSWAHVR